MTVFYTFIIFALIFIFIIVFSSRFFYFLELKTFTKRLSNTLHIDILRLDCSFEQMVYFLSLPSNLPIIKNVKPEELTIEFDYTSLIFPRLSGIKIYIKTNKEKMVLAYLPTKDFRLPTLDQMLEQGKIDEGDYLKISTYKLIHQTTLKEITGEVFKQLQVGSL